MNELELAHEQGRLQGLKEALEVSNTENMFTTPPQRIRIKIEKLEEKISTAVVEPAEDDGKKKARKLIQSISNQRNFKDELHIHTIIGLIREIFNLSED